MGLMAYLAIFCCAGCAAWALLPAPAQQAPRFVKGELIGAQPGLWAWVQQFFGAKRRKVPAGAVADELSLLRPEFAGRAEGRGGLARFLAWAAKAAPMSSGRAHEVGSWLDYLGSGLKAQEFGGLKILSAVVSLVSTIVLLPDLVRAMPFMPIMVCVVGFLAPELWLRVRIASRHKTILRALPEVIDLLALCMNAGLDFLGALNRVVAAKAGHDARKEPLLEELSLVIQEIKFGKRRSEALKAMAVRVNLPELSSFVRTLVQADRMGTPIAEVLAAHSEDVRFDRYNRAEKAALKAPIKILVPLIFCILPCVAIIVAAPILLQFTRLNVFGQH